MLFRSLSAVLLATLLFACDDTPDGQAPLDGGDPIDVGAEPDAGPEPDDNTAELQAALESLAASEVTDYALLGIGLTVQLADGRVFTAAAGASDPDGTPYRVDATEQVIGSVTKLYTAVMTLQLVEEGTLTLDDTLDAWFDLPGADVITVRMLLKHQSGFGDYLDALSEAERGQPWTPEALTQRAIEGGAYAAPGGPMAWYSNTNFLLLARIIEAETGMSWSSNIAERIAEPLDLRHTYYAGDEAAARNLVGGWMRTPDGWVDSLSFLDPSIGWGAGAVVTTNAELTRFAEALFAGELFSDPATLTAMMTFDTEVAPETLHGFPPTQIGLCMLSTPIDGLRLEGHTGGITGYGAGALRDAETGALIVVTANTEGVVPPLTALKIAQYLHSRR
ncbi:MAG: beta-lactamase family protein [Myxococcales bacterium]|nr:beta-lactamase family protein [Myxococcales bacterium]